MTATLCPGCPDGVKGPGKYLCWGCWTSLSMAARNALKRRGSGAIGRLSQLYDQIHDGVPLAEIQITP